MAANLQATTSQLAQSLASTQLATTAATAVYTVPAASSAVVKQGVLCNVSGQSVATLTTALTTAGNPTVTSLGIAALPVALGQGAQIVLTSGANTQTWTLSAPAAANAVTLAVVGQVPNFSYPNPTTITTLAQDAAVTCSVVPSGAGNDGTHVLIYRYPLVSGDSLSLAPYMAGAQLAAGDAIYVTSSVPSVVDVTVTGVVST